MFLYQADTTEVVQSLFGSVNVSSTAQNGDGVDLANAQTAPLVTILGSVQSGSVTFTVETSADDSTYAAVDASDLIDPETGEASTFTVATVASGAIAETLAVRRENVSRYIRVVGTPTSGVATYAGIVTYSKKYTS